MEYINHLAYILNPVVEKHYEDVTYEIRDLSTECCIEVKWKPRGSRSREISPIDDQVVYTDVGSKASRGTGK